MYVKASVSPKFVGILEEHVDVNKRVDEARKETTEKLRNEINKVISEKNLTGVYVNILKRSKTASAESLKATFDKINGINNMVDAKKRVSDAYEAVQKAKDKARNDATLENVTPKNVDKGSAELEGQISYKHDMLTFGFNSKTNFPFSNKTYAYENDKFVEATAADYGRYVKSTHKIFVESEKDKDVYVKGLRDVESNLEIKHNYAKNVVKPGERVDYVSGHLGAAYEGVEKLRLEGAFDFKVNVNKVAKLDDGDFKDTIGAYNYSDTYDFKAIYTGVEGLKLTVNPFLGHYNLFETYVLRSDIVTYGVNLEAEYKMLNDKLTLTGKSKLQGASLLLNGVGMAHHGKFDFDVNAKYKYDVNEKFNVTPEATAHLTLNTLQGTLTGTELTLTPKVSAEYKPTDTLTLTGSVETPVKFKTVGKEFKYTDTQIKTSLNLKYEWK
ncbi:TonB-dependent receptor [Sneathia sp. DSM 16631]|uniref:TonB-dependent receptor n=1 Tax=Sneathia TaxID=168808 RepID=UPI0018679EF6|nr:MULTISPECIES: TonB-dependent receptor [Sneathia]MBE3030850.1 TonB-dependent receptor [Sneathia sp. DSM 16631]MDK9581361.1 TonB-dependent receptor [Sneathia vaginalis]